MKDEELRSKNKIEIIRRCSMVLFAVYMVALILVIVFKYPTGMVSRTIKSWVDGNPVKRIAPQLIPFKTNIFYIKNIHSLNDWFILNVACNIVMFMPYGFLLPQILKSRQNLGRKVIISGCIFSVLIEIFQYITALGVCDIDDVILNTLSVALGFGIYKIIRYIYKRRSED